MTLPLTIPYAPMEALAKPELPKGRDWVFEPKWDGFRCLAFKDGKQVRIQSKSGQPLDRYFPEMVTALEAIPVRFVLDGELLIARGGSLSFDLLLRRIHPAESRVRKLSSETPATFILFDLLVDDHGRSLVDQSFADRRAALERFFGRYLKKEKRIRLSPQTADFGTARRWFHDMRDVLDGVVAKNRTARYESGLRTGSMQKIKNIRTADCVVGGFRMAAKGGEVGSLLLGLYDEKGLLDHVGFTSAFDATFRRKLRPLLLPLVEPPGFTGAAPGGPSRWSRGRNMDWKPLRPVLVAEVKYDHFTGGRFRHGTAFLRWRSDKEPRQCRLSQVQHESRSPLGVL